jgi:hypothetical protein
VLLSGPRSSRSARHLNNISSGQRRGATSA